MPNFDHANRLFGKELTLLMDENMDFLRKRFEGWSERYKNGNFKVGYLDVQRAYLDWRVGEYLGKVGEGMATYWYANATRFIPYTIHEFPGYSFVVSDIHGHVLSLPYALLAIGLLS